MMRTFVFCLGVGLLSCSGEGSPGAATAEVADTQIQLDLPPVPTFDEPQGYPDGSHSVLEMRRRGKKFLDQNVKVKGYVIWSYDCTQVLGAKVAQDTPERCDKPNFYLGDTPNTSPEKAVWIVEVPRAPRPDEKKFLPKEELAAWPAVPVYAVGQHVVVDGKWATRSPKGFVNSDGLLAYANLTAVP